MPEETRDTPELVPLESPDEMKPEGAEAITPEALAARFPEAVLQAQAFRGDTVALVRPERIREVCLALRDDPVWRMNFLADLTCADHFPAEPRFHVVYQLRSIPAGRHVTLKVMLPSNEPEVDSVEPVWSTANWLEREVFDLFGITFRGHSNLRRIMMPEGWEGHPLRRDYSVGKARIPF